MEEQIADILKDAVGCLKINDIAMGPRSSFSSCLIYDTDRGKYFVKVHRPHIPGMFEAEAKCLQHIDNTATIRVPEPVFYGFLDDASVLILKHLDLVPHTPETERKLGNALARLHQTRATSPFGYDFTTFLGTTPQQNTLTRNWVEFFSQYRLLPLSRLVKDETVADGCEAVLELVPDLFKGIEVKPSLLHGDLWNGNTAATREGEPVVFDPSCYYGHHEADLSIASLFGGFSSAFFDAYHEKIPQEKGFADRQNLYKLYHMLNHYHLFGDSYRDGTLSLIQELI